MLCKLSAIWPIRALAPVVLGWERTGEMKRILFTVAKRRSLLGRAMCERLAGHTPSERGPAAGMGQPATAPGEQPKRTQRRGLGGPSTRTGMHSVPHLRGAIEAKQARQ